MQHTRSAGCRWRLAGVCRIIHEKSTAAEIGELLAAARADAAGTARHAASAADHAVLRLAQKSYEENARVPTELAQRKAALSSEAYSQWAKARAASDFGTFRPALEKCFATASEVAAAKLSVDGGDDGGGGTLYTQMLSEYEPGMAAECIDELFSRANEALVPLISRVLASPYRPDHAAVLRGNFSLAAQESLNREVVEALGFAPPPAA